MFKNRVIGLPLFLLATVLVMLVVWYAAPEPGDKTFTVKKKEDGTPATPKGAQPAAWVDGKSMYRANCASCHNIKVNSTGPALMGVSERWKAAGSYKGKTGEQWMHIWIHNWHDAVGGGYKYAINMADSRPAEMNIFVNLNDENIDKILLYVNNPDGVMKKASN